MMHGGCYSKLPAVVPLQSCGQGSIRTTAALPVGQEDVLLVGQDQEVRREQDQDENNFARKNGDATSFMGR